MNVSSDEAELCENWRLAGPSTTVRSGSNRDVGALGGSRGGSNRGVFTILLGSEDTSSTTGRRGSCTAGGVDGPLLIPVCDFCDLRGTAGGLAWLSARLPDADKAVLSVGRLAPSPRCDLRVKPEFVLAPLSPPSGCPASLNVAALITTEGGGFGFVLRACRDSRSRSPSRPRSPSPGLLGLGGPSFATLSLCPRWCGAGSRFLTGSTSIAARFLPSNREINEPVGWIDSISDCESPAPIDTTLPAPKLGRLVMRECICVADMDAWANPPPWLGVGLGEPDLLAASVAAIYDADGRDSA